MTPGSINISKTTSGTLVSDSLKSNNQQGDGSTSSMDPGASRTLETAYTETTQDGQTTRKRDKLLRLPGVSFGSDLVPTMSFRRPSQPSSSRQPPSCPGSSETQEQLAILGYRQELHRSWDFSSLFALSFCNVSILNGSFTSLLLAYQLRGPVLMTVGTLATSCFLIGVNAIFAEMASAFPVAGAMFIWTFKLARSIPWLRSWARLISWIIGFFLLTAHLMLQLEIGTEFTKILTTAILASGVEWSATEFRRKLISFAYVTLCGLASITPFGRSPLAWKYLGITTLLLNLSACIVLRTTAKHQGNFWTLFSVYPRHYSFASKGYTMLRGWSVATVVIGSEPAAHMAEETRNPASTVPRAIFFNSVFCGFWQLFCNVFVTLAITPLQKASNHPPGTSGVVNTLYMRCPPAAARFVTAILLITSLIANTAQFLATSRFFWALARDKALPFAKFWRQITTDRRPVRATGLMITLSVLLVFLSLEPSGWIGRFASEGASFLVLSSYLAPCVLYLCCKQDVYDQDGRNVWTLQGFSKPIALISSLFLALLLALYSGPVRYPINKDSFPLAPFAGVGFLIISLIFWFVYGRFHFAGPVKSLSTWSVGFEIELPKKISRRVIPQNQTRPRDATTTRPTGAETLNPRSDAVLTTQANYTLGIPQSYVTYGSDGSLWAESQDQSNR
ncbi:hypothetical protein PCANC_15060 [Puccinia coronata f. sp. avenae]|uniref:Amino acid permease/ SLC12A domain-containing protein n=1 Tax=Puccinia coronata f. sp. avenae TaxID=200324 RepID=A0A2N5UAJ5_9BASI|nr:hypothetical protein PCASD_16793 [Puccinia coronata f. sp. avenae]PLW34728.1 hypothetical protein PCANC_15060 [Puccinia coronata f. sp. avenae]